MISETNLMVRAEEPIELVVLGEESTPVQLTASMFEMVLEAGLPLLSAAEEKPGVDFATLHYGDSTAVELGGAALPGEDIGRLFGQGLNVILRKALELD